MSRAGARTIALRLLFASFPLWSLGLLAWVPALRIALLRRRGADWAAAVLFAALTVVYMVVLFTVPEDDENLSALAGAYLLLFFAATVVHGILADRFPRPRSRAPHPAGPALPDRRTVPLPVPTQPGHPPHPPSPTQAPHPPSPTQAPHPPPHRPAAEQPVSPRMRHVASELDELGDLLRRQDGGPR